MPKTLKLTSEEREKIRQLLVELPVSRDALPYTTAFSELKQRVEDALGRKFGGADFWRAISGVAKRGLGGPRKPRVPAPPLTPEQQLEILHLMPQGTGSRDRLPYTPELDALWRRFKSRTGTNLTKNDFWLALVSAAKKSRKPKAVLDDLAGEGLPAEIVLLLRDANPWWQGKPAPQLPPYRRAVFHEMRRLLDRREGSSVVLCGPRQVGKSTLLGQLVEQLLLIEGVDASRILRVPLDEIAPATPDVPPLEELIAWYDRTVMGTAAGRATARKPAYVLVDAIDRSPHWLAQLAPLVGRAELRLVATLDRRIAKLEATKASVLPMGPLDLCEIGALRGLRSWPSFSADRSLWTTKEFWLDTVRQYRRHARPLAAALDAYATRGGFPLGHRNCDFTKSELGEHLARVLVREPTLQAASSGQKAESAVLLREVFTELCRAAGRPLCRTSLAQELAARLRHDVSPKDVARAVEFFVDRLLVAPIPATTWTGGEANEEAILAVCDPLLREAWLREPVAFSTPALDSATADDREAAETLVRNILGYFLKLSGTDVSWLPEREATPAIDLVVTVTGRRIPIVMDLRDDRPLTADVAPLAQFVEEADAAAGFGLVVTDAVRGKLGAAAVAISPAMLLAVIQARGEPASPGLPLFHS